MNFTEEAPHASLLPEDVNVPEEWLSTLQLTEAAAVGTPLGDAAGKLKVRRFLPVRLHDLLANRSRSVNHSPAHLKSAHRRHARALTAEAMFLMYHHAGECGYSEGSDRWDEINAEIRDRKRRARYGDTNFPVSSDCSSSATWALAQGLWYYHCSDVVNGQRWRAGYTGTMINHGIHAGSPRYWMRGDAIIFGESTSSTVHVALNMGWDKRYRSHMVLNHGTPGVQYMRWSDMGMPVAGVRRYI